jgi:uncharacterized membrane protein
MKDKKYMVFAAMGFELVGVVLAAIFLGQMLDEKIGTKGIMVAVIAMVGLAGWTYHLYKFDQKNEKELEENKKDH